MTLGRAFDRMCWATLVICIWVIKDPIIDKVAITLLVVEAMFVRNRLSKG